MPIRNIGTLLENIVLTEAMRLLNQANHQKLPFDFLNSFALPPLSVFVQHTFDCGFSEENLQAFSLGPQPGEVGSFENIMWSCLQQPQGQESTQGPNGALLCAVLAHYLNCTLRLWLNDIPNGPYENTIPRLYRINDTVQQILRLAQAPSNEVVVCERRWPLSLITPTENNLTETLAEWGVDAHARLGFLDPMRYRENNANGPETGSISHQQWLGIISEGFPRSVISVHFTGHRNWLDLREEIPQMHRDGLAQGYGYTLVANHNYYHVVCNIKHPDSESANLLALQLKETVRVAWNAWFRAGGRRPAVLNLAVL